VQDAPEYLTSDRNAAEMSAAWTMIDPWFALGLSGCCKRPGSPQVRLIPRDAADFTLNEKSCASQCRIASVAKVKKRMGRPPTGMNPMVGFRCPPALTRRVDNWAKRQPDKPARGEAIRRLLTDALDRAEASE
jgi:hypothetical protein